MRRETPKLLLVVGGEIVKTRQKELDKLTESVDGKRRGEDRPHAGLAAGEVRNGPQPC